MKVELKHFCFWCLITLSLSAFGQKGNSYYVIRVKGMVVNNTSEQPVDVRDKFNATDEISFGSMEDFVVVISSMKGQLVLKPQKSHEVKGQLRYYVEENLIPLQKHTSTRGQLTEFYNENDLKYFFESRNYLLLEKNRFWLFRDVFDLRDSSYLFIGYEYDGQKVDYKMPYDYDSQVLLIDKTAMFTWNKKPIDPKACDNFILFYYDAVWDKAFAVSKLSFASASDRQLTQDIDLIREYSSVNNESEALRAEVYSYIRMMYGNFDEESLNQLIDL